MNNKFFIETSKNSKNRKPGAYDNIFSKVDWRRFIRKPISNEELLQRINEIISYPCKPILRVLGMITKDKINPNTTIPIIERIAYVVTHCQLTFHIRQPLLYL
jgi:hypothetical protein